MRTYQKHIVEFPAMFEYSSIANYCKIVNYQNDVWLVETKITRRTSRDF
jgi:hypothetical protein